MPPASVSRPRRASAQRTAEKISSSLKAESGAIPEREPKPERKTKRPLASGDAGPVPKVKREKPSSAPKSSAPKVKQEKPSSAPKSSAPKVKQAKPGKAKASAAPAGGGGGGGDVLLGHFISKCVGIQHYRGNGVRYNKEPLQLRRDPNNPYDCNAVAVHTVAGKMVGIWFPISTFVAIGFEHSVANMFLLPLGLLKGADLSLGDVLLKNMLPVTIGNAVAGALIVAAGYSYAFGKLGEEKA